MAKSSTALVIFSLVYFTCMKIRTTTVALQVAITRATTVLNGPRSTVAIQAVKNVAAIRKMNTIQFSLLGTMCPVCSDIGSLKLPAAGQSNTATGKDRSRQYRQNASTAPQFRAACDIPA